MIERETKTLHENILLQKKKDLILQKLLSSKSYRYSDLYDENVKRFPRKKTMGLGN